jgi:hypothetical protein
MDHREALRWQPGIEDQPARRQIEHQKFGGRKWPQPRRHLVHAESM